MKSTFWEPPESSPVRTWIWWPRRDSAGPNERRRKVSSFPCLCSRTVFPVPDGSSVSSTNTVSVGPDARIEAGINSYAVMWIMPVTLAGVPQIDPAAFGHLLSEAEKIQYGLPLSIDYEYQALGVEEIAFNVTTGTVIEVAEGALAGRFFRFKPQTDQSVPIVLDQEDYTDALRWEEIAVHYDLTKLAPGTQVALQTNQVVRTADDVLYRYIGGICGEL